MAEDRPQPATEPLFQLHVAVANPPAPSPTEPTRAEATTTHEIEASRPFGSRPRKQEGWRASFHSVWGKEGHALSLPSKGLLDPAMQQVGRTWREDLAIELAGEIQPEEMTLAERAQAKADRLDASAHKRHSETNAFRRAANELSRAFEFGQPIAAATLAATVTSMPGNVIRRRIVGSLRACTAISASTTVSASLI